MKKHMKKALAWLGAAMMSIGLITSPAISSKAADPYDGEFEVFVGFGGDAKEENDWGMQFNDPNNAGNNPDIKATTATAKVGDTVTVSLEFPDAVPNVWWMAPVLVGEGVGALDTTVSLKIDDADVEIDASKGDAWWYEQTGDFDDTKAIRLYGGFNEWAAQYIAEPSGFKKVEYTITINSAEKAEAKAMGGAFEGEAELFIGFGGDAAEENDWGMQFNDPNNAGNNPDIKAVTETIKVGETKTVSLEFPDAVPNVWWMAPVLVAENIGDIDATVSLKIDDTEVEIDPSQGDMWWYEQTGDLDDKHAIRLYGGFNEWAAQYIAEPSGFKKVEYTVTLNSASIVAPEETPELIATLGTVEKDNPDYNAYILIQSPKYSFRNAWYDAQYGLGYTDDTGMDYFNQITGWDASNNAVVIPGKIQDTKIDGNGTYTVSVTGLQFADDDFKDQDHFNLIAVDTDIPNTGDITISDMELQINGMGVDIKPVISPDSEEYLTMLIQNIWNEDVKEIGYTPTPVTDVKITFKVSGFNKDSEQTVTEATTEATTAATTEAAAADTKKDEKKKGLSSLAIAAICGGAGLVVIIIAVLVVSAKKKKKQ
ncbi:MAG: hypothetical protein IKO61_10005 [Lachnospiraceae bacterium]|nr:hypothetical protein [Lachnospiraceae bacterium]